MGADGSIDINGAGTLRRSRLILAIHDMRGAGRFVAKPDRQAELIGAVRRTLAQVDGRQ